MLNKVKIYKISSNNTEHFYIGTTQKYTSALLNDFIVKYKIYHKYHDSVLKPKNIQEPIWHDAYAIIDHNDIKIETLHTIHDIHIEKYMQPYDNDQNNIKNIQHGTTLNNKLEQINIIKTIRLKNYYKEYYKNNKDNEKIKQKNKEYYQKNKEKLLEKKNNSIVDNNLTMCKKYKKTVLDYINELEDCP